MAPPLLNEWGSMGHIKTPFPPPWTSPHSRSSYHPRPPVMHSTVHCTPHSPPRIIFSEACIKSSSLSINFFWQFVQRSFILSLSLWWLKTNVVGVVAVWTELPRNFWVILSSSPFHHNQLWALAGGHVGHVHMSVARAPLGTWHRYWGWDAVMGSCAMV